MTTSLSCTPPPKIENSAKSLPPMQGTPPLYPEGWEKKIEGCR